MSTYPGDDGGRDDRQNQSDERQSNDEGGTETDRESSSGASGSVDGLDEPLTVRVEGAVPRVAIRRTRQTARKLTKRLPAAVATLSETTDVVENVHVARLVERALAFERETDGAFDVRERPGRLAASADETGSSGPVRFDRPGLPEQGVAAAAVPVDLSRIAGAYVVDRVAATLARSDRTGRVAGDGFASRASGIRIVGPRGEEWGHLESDWSLATTAGTTDPERIELAHGEVLVLAERDCTAAAAFADLIRESSPAWAREEIDDRDGVVALIAHRESVRPTAEFDAHRR